MATKSSKKATKKVNKSTYKNDVLLNNSRHKNAVRSTGKGLRILVVSLDGQEGAAPMIATINKILRDEQLYKLLDTNVRRLPEGTKNAGKTCPFYILQTVHRIKEGKLKIGDVVEPKSKKASKSAPKKGSVKTQTPKPDSNADLVTPKKLQSQTVPQLKKLLKDMGIGFASNAKKATLLNLVKENA